jgi:hypothetical protein
MKLRLPVRGRTNSCFCVMAGPGPATRDFTNAI